MSSDVIKTSERFPPSIGLMVMLGKLAYIRVYGAPPTSDIPYLRPAPRDSLDAQRKPATRQFYRMIDRINRGEQP